MESASGLLVDIQPSDSTNSPVDGNRFNRPLRATIEPAIFLIFFAFTFASVVNQNQIIKLTCSTIFGFNETVCELVGTEDANDDIKNIDKLVQPYAAKVLMVLSIAGTVVPALVGMFYGTWSDKFGRKPILLASATGFFFSSVLTTSFTYLSKFTLLNPWIYILCSIPSSLVGGISSLLGGSYCYIADITTVKQQPLKLTILGAYLSAGLFFGSLASGYAYEAWNSTVVFGIATLVHFVGVAYIAIFVKESRNVENLETSPEFRGLFQLSLVKDMIKTLIKRRPSYYRSILYVCTGALCGGAFVMEGTSNIFFLFVREKFSWTTKDYTTYNAVGMVFGSFGSASAILICEKILGLSTTSVVLIGLGSHVVDNVIKTVATKPWHLYLAIGITAPKGVAFPMLRSLISNVVPADDLGKVYSLAIALECIMPLGAAPLYTYVYSMTLDVYSGIFNALGVVIYFLFFLMVTVLFGMETENPDVFTSVSKR